MKRSSSTPQQTQDGIMGTVYVLQFSKPIGNMDNPRGQAQFYVGWASDFDARLQAHRTKQGARITAAAVEAGCEILVVATFPGTRHDERAIKNRKNTPAWLKSHGFSFAVAN